MSTLNFIERKATVQTHPGMSWWIASVAATMLVAHGLLRFPVAALA
ncbi:MULTISPECIES: hypothetical protein [unclassified Leucobacter]|nr:MULTISPECIES: hypothetical protein [unclassified Leucobacter]